MEDSGQSSGFDWLRTEVCSEDPQKARSQDWKCDISAT